MYDIMCTTTYDIINKYAYNTDTLDDTYRLVIVIVRRIDRAMSDGVAQRNIYYIQTIVYNNNNNIE